MLHSKGRTTWVGGTVALGTALAFGFWTGACAGRQTPPPLAPAPSSGAAPTPPADPPIRRPRPQAHLPWPRRPRLPRSGPGVRNDCGSCPCAHGGGRASERHELLNAVVWMQTAAEFRAAMRAAYGRAEVALDALLADKTATAALEQTGDSPPCPRCDPRRGRNRPRQHGVRR